jgi:transcription initiation factor TFIIB
MGVDTTVVKCLECQSRNLVYDENRGERHCEDCGLLLEEGIVDQSPEWREFNEGGDATNRSRVGAPVTNLIHDKGLSTQIDWQNRDYAGAAINSKSRSQMYRMRKWQIRSRVKGSQERNLSIALVQMGLVCSKMGLPRTINERGADIYTRALKSGLIRGRSIEGTVAASLFIANQQLLTARTVDDFAKVTKLTPKEISRTYRDMKRKLSIKTPVPTPMVYVGRFVSKLGLNSETERRTREIIKLAEERELTHGKSPSGIVAAALYIAGQQTGQIRTQREIAEVTNVTEVTIRNRYKQLANSLGIVLEI